MTLLTGLVACVASTNYTGHMYAHNELLNRPAPSEKSLVSHFEANRLGLGAAASNCFGWTGEIASAAEVLLMIASAMI